MVFKTLKLGDGRTATLEWLTQEDLPEVVEALNSVVKEGRFLFMNNEITDMEEEKRWYERSIEAGMRYLVVRVDQRVVGGASLHPRTDKSAHIAEYGIFIRQGYRNLGLGTLLTQAFVGIAKDQELEILQLSVYASNERALHVYKKCGYRECGRLTRDIRFLDGTYTDRVMMELLLKYPRTGP